MWALFQMILWNQSLTQKPPLSSPQNPNQPRKPQIMYALLHHLLLTDLGENVPWRIVYIKTKRTASSLTQNASGWMRGRKKNEKEQRINKRGRSYGLTPVM